LELVEASGGASGFEGMVEVTFQATAAGGAEIMVDASGEVATEFGYTWGGAGSDPLLVTVVETGAATPVPTGAEPATAAATDFMTPDPAECTIAPRTTEELAALAATPDLAATDALAEASALSGLDIPAEQPADEATAAAVLATYREITACLNAGNTLAAYALWTDRALRQLGLGAPTGPRTATPEGERGALRVIQVQVLPDGRIAAVWEKQGPLLLVTIVQALVREGDRYLVDETLDFTMRSK
jgi:hypothetical protein